MALKAEIVCEQELGGAHKCAANKGGHHAATWHFRLRVFERGDLVATDWIEKGAREGHLCDAHLYPALRWLHNEIQSMQAVRQIVLEGN